MNVRAYCIFVILLLFAQDNRGESPAAFPKAGEAKIVHFGGPLPDVRERTAELKYDYDLANESFEIFIPKNYSSNEAFGLFVFIDSQNEMTVPKDWRSIMEQRKLICLIPQKVGNDQPSPRRMGLSLIGILKMTDLYRINPKRVFSGGFSGGARTALHLAFLQAGLISGNISICGADFYEPVPKVKALDTRGYGVWPVSRELAAKAKANVRFAFITGSKDFRHGNILDIYEGGFMKNSFRVYLIDLPDMGHQLCTADTLAQAIEYLDRND